MPKGVTKKAAVQLRLRKASGHQKASPVKKPAPTKSATAKKAVRKSPPPCHHQKSHHQKAATKKAATKKAPPKKQPLRSPPPKSSHQKSSRQAARHQEVRGDQKSAKPQKRRPLLDPRRNGWPRRNPGRHWRFTTVSLPQCRANSRLLGQCHGGRWDSTPWDRSFAFAILPRCVSAPFQITLQNDLSGQLIDLLFSFWRLCRRG